MLTILIVDDDPVSRMVAARTIASEFDDVLVLDVETAEDAREIVERERVDVALVDIMLSGGPTESHALARWLDEHGVEPRYFSGMDPRDLRGLPYPVVCKTDEPCTLLSHVRVAASLAELRRS